ncbi:MAG TPA: hypothetical protein VFR97_02515 [Capillimicrobium sp.]|nr:hypothetical protein [Capillimicrobium sp.]
MIDLEGGARLLSQHVDGLELTCAVAQVPLLLRQRPDDLDARLGRLQARARATLPHGAVPSEWCWDDEPVLVLPHSLRPGARYCIECSDWAIFVAPVGSVVPRLTVQLRADYLLRVGPLGAYDASREWVEDHLVPLIGGRPPEDRPAWRISRLDLAADVAGVVFQLADLDHFTTRAASRRSYTGDAEQ